MEQLALSRVAFIQRRRRSLGFTRITGKFVSSTLKANRKDTIILMYTIVIIPIILLY